MKLCQKIGQSLEESLQGGKLVKNFKIIILNEWQNSYWIWLLYDVKNYADLGGCYPPRLTRMTFSSICVILHILLSLFQKLLIKIYILWTNQLIPSLLSCIICKQPWKGCERPYRFWCKGGSRQGRREKEEMNGRSWFYQQHSYKIYADKAAYGLRRLDVTVYL